MCSILKTNHVRTNKITVEKLTSPKHCSLELPQTSGHFRTQIGVGQLR